ncbi:MAG: hypothetical protein LBM93_07540 [Oscillospiraceae bacterium]|jgi:hypothetical protein|nr:hypothetical protein [Oscillospiraceae bacterium]
MYKKIISLTTLLTGLVMFSSCELTIPVSESVSESMQNTNTGDSVSVPETNQTSTENSDGFNEIIEGFPPEFAVRAGVVALTNYWALDVFTEDGNSYDTEKFHKFSDANNPEYYYWNIRNDGFYVKKSENTYQIVNLEMETYSYKPFVMEVSFDVTYDGENYIVSNLEGTGPSQMDLSFIEQESGSEMFLIISPDKINEERASEFISPEDNSEKLSRNEAQKIFEDYGELLYPYGFKCHWIIDLRAAEQDANGSWFLKVGVTVTNAFGQERKIVAEGTVNANTLTVEGFYD